MNCAGTALGWVSVNFDDVSKVYTFSSPADRGYYFSFKIKRIGGGVEVESACSTPFYFNDETPSINIALDDNQDANTKVLPISYKVTFNKPVLAFPFAVLSWTGIGNISNMTFKTVSTADINVWKVVIDRLDESMAAPTFLINASGVSFITNEGHAASSNSPVVNYQQLSYSIYEAAKTGFGTALATYPDLDGDGRDDLIITAPGEGKVYAYIYNGTTFVEKGSYDFATNGYGTGMGKQVIVGQFYTATGSELEIAVSDYLYNSTEGRVFVLTPTWNGSTVDFTSRGMIPGIPGSWFGFSIANLGDLNLDGLDELAIGAPNADSAALAGVDTKGSVFLYHGFDVSFYDEISVTDSEDFGKAVAAGDVNEDGFSEILIGDPLFSHGGGAYGKVFLYDKTKTLLGSQLSYYYDNLNAYGFNLMLWENLDLVGNTHPEIVVSQDNVFGGGSTGGGVIHKYSYDSGVLANVNPVIEGMRLYDHYGSIMTTGDIDLDGKKELVVVGSGSSSYQPRFAVYSTVLATPKIIAEAATTLSPQPGLQSIVVGRVTRTIGNKPDIIMGVGSHKQIYVYSP